MRVLLLSYYLSKESAVYIGRVHESFLMIEFYQEQNGTYRTVCFVSGQKDHEETGWTRENLVDSFGDWFDLSNVILPRLSSLSLN